MKLVLTMVKIIKRLEKDMFLKSKKFFLTGFLAVFLAVVIGIVKAASLTTVVVQPINQTIDISEHASLNIEVNEVVDLYAYDLTLKYDPAVLDLQEDDYEIGDFFTEPTRPLGPWIDEINGTIQIVVSKQGKLDGTTGSGNLLTLNFTGLDFGTSVIELTQEDCMLLDSDGKKIDFDVQNGEINVGVLPSPSPSASSSPSLSPSPSFSPKVSPSPSPSRSPSSSPSPSLSPSPSSVISPSPSPSTSLSPSPSPSISPSASPSPIPISSPSPSISPSPKLSPSPSPSESPKIIEIMLSGVVLDAVTGEGIEGAKVTVGLPDVKGKKGDVGDTVTLKNGNYAIDNLQPGEYLLKVKARKYWPYEKEITILNSLTNANNSQDISLEPKGGRGKFADVLNGFVNFVKGFFRRFRD